MSLQAVIHDAKPNQYQSQGRASILGLMEPSLCHIPFPFDAELFKDAVKYFDYVYGIAVDIAEVIFPDCDCTDDTGNPTYHVTCKKPAVVIVKHLYTEEEMYRREADANEVIDQFARLEEEIDVWLEIKEGKAALKHQLEKYRAYWKENLSINDELIHTYRQELKVSRQKVDLLHEQMNKFASGIAFSRPLFKTEDEARDLLAIENEKIKVSNMKLEKLAELEEQLKSYTRLKSSELKMLAIRQLKKKYCYLEYHEQILERQRRYALRNKLARPWDGVDGADYISWWRCHALDGTTDAAMERSGFNGNGLSKVGRKRQITESVDGEGIVQLTLEAEYNWDGCEEIGMNFNLDLYEYYLTSRSKNKNFIY